jgi:site-specific DNA-adenine methylase
MMIKFYIPWNGCKRNDMKYIKDAINLKGINRILEPFCGSCAFSLFCYRELEFKGEIILNDNDKNLIDFFKDVKQNGSKKYFDFIINTWNDGKLTLEEHLEKMKPKNIKSTLDWFYFQRCNGRFRRVVKKAEFTTAKYEKNKNVISSLDRFFMDDNIKLFCGDYSEIIDKYKDDPHTLIYLDPPFMSSYNADYAIYYTDKKNPDKSIKDYTQIFVDLLELLKSKTKIITSINSNCLIRYLYKDYIFNEFKKIYQATKSKEMQLILSNIKI